MLSVVVPVYNAEKYVSRCLDSLLVQGVEDYEIICVNDGSTDGTKKVLETYRNAYPQIVRIVDQENSGCPAARNAGIMAARGNVLTFCDADDYLIPNAYSYLLDNFWKDGIDVLHYDSITLDAYVSKTWNEANDVEGKIVFEGDGLDFYKQGMLYFVWQNLYRKSFLINHGIQFRPYALCDDTAFCLDVFMKNPYTVYVNSNVYRYTIVEGQLTRQRNEKSMRRIVESYLNLFRSLGQYACEIPGMKPVLLLYREQQMIPCMSRILSSAYSRKEWSALKSALCQIGIMPMHLIGKTTKVMNFVMSNYVNYWLAANIYRTIFVPHVLPNMKRN